MKFEELQRKWADQKKEDMYTINLEAVRQRVSRKKEGANQLSERVEKFLIGCYLLGGVSLLLIASVLKEGDLGTYLIGFAALIMAGYVIHVRMSRLRASGTFDRSLQGDLDQAISDTRHRVRISRLTLWSIPFVAITITAQYWINGKPIWAVGLLLLFFVLAFLAGRWEHNKLHLGRLKELERLKKELNKTEL
jgi:hypothetical protein